MRQAGRNAEQVARYPHLDLERLGLKREIFKPLVYISSKDGILRDLGYSKI